jgi:hypothetical protein
LTFQDELEKWIIVYLVTHADYTVSPRTIIDEAPRTLITKIQSENELSEFLMNMELSKGFLKRTFVLDFKLSTQGKLYFRKFIEPLFIIAKDKKKYLQIIDQTEGTPETKKSFKKILDSIKDKLPDDAERILTESLTKASVEAIFYLVRLVVTAPHAN